MKTVIPARWPSFPWPILLREGEEQAHYTLDPMDLSIILTGNDRLVNKQTNTQQKYAIRM